MSLFCNPQGCGSGEPPKAGDGQMTLSSENFTGTENRLDLTNSGRLGTADLYQDNLYATPRTNTDTSGAFHLPEVQFCQAPARSSDVTSDVITSAASGASDLSTRAVLASWGRRGNNPGYSPSAGAVGAIVGLDVTPDFIAGVAARAFAALEPATRALAGDHRRAEPITGPGGRPAALRCNGQEIQLQINGQNRSIPMNLEGMGPNDYVTLYRVPRQGGGWNLMAVNPANNRSWTFGDVQYNADPSRLVGAAFGNGGRGLMGGWQWVPNR